MHVRSNDTDTIEAYRPERQENTFITRKYLYKVRKTNLLNYKFKSVIVYHECFIHEFVNISILDHTNYTY